MDGVAECRFSFHSIGHKIISESIGFKYPKLKLCLETRQCAFDVPCSFAYFVRVIVRLRR